MRTETGRRVKKKTRDVVVRSAATAAAAAAGAPLPLPFLRVPRAPCQGPGARGGGSGGRARPAKGGGRPLHFFFEIQSNARFWSSCGAGLHFLFSSFFLLFKNHVHRRHGHPPPRPGRPARANRPRGACMWERERGGGGEPGKGGPPSKKGLAGGGDTRLGAPRRGGAAFLGTRVRPRRVTLAGGAAYCCSCGSPRPPCNRCRERPTEGAGPPRDAGPRSRPHERETRRFSRSRPLLSLSPRPSPPAAPLPPPGPRSRSRPPTRPCPRYEKERERENGRNATKRDERGNRPPLARVCSPAPDPLSHHHHHHHHHPSPPAPPSPPRASAPPPTSASSWSPPRPPAPPSPSGMTSPWPTRTAPSTLCARSRRSRPRRWRCPPRRGPTRSSRTSKRGPSASTPTTSTGIMACSPRRGRTPRSCTRSWRSRCVVGSERERREGKKKGGRGGGGGRGGRALPASLSSSSSSLSLSPA